jgi:uncharacterized protein (DUF427 family)
MSLTAVNGLLSERPSGRLNFDLGRPEVALYLDPVPYRVRALLAGETVVDSLGAFLLHETGRLPVFYFPADDVRRDLLDPAGSSSKTDAKGTCERWALRVGERSVRDAAWSYTNLPDAASFLRGLVALDFRAMDEWFCEDEQLHGHPRDPYSRIDVFRTSRHVRVSLWGELLAESRRASALYETGLPPRFYLPPDDVRIELLEPSSHLTRCAYKGSASYWSVRIGDRLADDLVWAYLDPQHDAEPIRDLYCFFNERVDLELDGEPVERPQTQWSRDETDKQRSELVTR